MHPQLKGNKPVGRYGHTATLHKDSMFVFGGWNNSYEDEAHQAFFLNLKNQTWSRLDFPISYENWGHTANLIRDSIYLFGRADPDNNKLTNDLVIFSVQNKTC